MPEVRLKNKDKIRKVYFVGIKGVGMAGLAIIAKEAGFKVQGSDVREEFITDHVLKKHGIELDLGFEAASVEKFIENKAHETLLITTAAHDGLKNPQCVYAKGQGIDILTHGQAVGYFMAGELFKRQFKGISVLGCHGKTTVTGMVASALSVADLDLTHTLGTSEIFPIGDAGHLGKGEYFVAEADEFISDINKDRTVKFLYQYPDYAIINNIDFDHPDVYKSLEEVNDAFFTFVSENIQNNGTLIINGDDKELLNIKIKISNLKFKDKNLRIITFGEKDGNDIRIVDFHEIGWGSKFEVISMGTNLGIFKLSVPGYHNAKNSLSVIALMIELGIKLDLIKKSVSFFQGTKRRQERLGTTKNGAIIIDDYAHHPDEIVKTIEAVKIAFPDRKIICLFQPHTLGRTQALRDQFATAFGGVDEVIFLSVFTSKREGEVNYEQLYSSIKKTMQNTGVNVHFPADSRNPEEMKEPPFFYEKNRQKIVKYILGNYDSSDYLVLTLGAGDLYRIGYDLRKN